MGKTELKLEVDAELLEAARRADIALDAALEGALRQALEAARPLDLVASARSKAADPAGGDARAAAWAEENAEAIESHNRFVETHGVFGEDLRSW